MSTQTPAQQPKGNVFIKGTLYELDDIGSMCVEEYHRTGDDGVKQFLEEILSENPGNGEVFSTITMLYFQAGKYDDAVIMADRTIALDPTNDEYYLYKADLLKGLGDINKSLECCDETIAVNPLNASAYSLKADILYQIKNFDYAEACLRKVIELEPENELAIYRLGIILFGRKEVWAALAKFEEAIRIDPKYVGAYYNRGKVFLALEHYENALESFEKALELSPNESFIYKSIAEVLNKLGRDYESIRAYESALALEKDEDKDPEVFVYEDFLYTKLSLCEWDNLKEIYDKAIDQIDRGIIPSGVLPLLCSPIDSQRLLKITELTIKECFAPQQSLWNGEIYSHKKIRIAYISPDFRDHPLSFLMVGVFENHDREQFETYGISLTPEGSSDMGMRVKAAFDHYHDVSALDAKQIAKMLRDLEIDIALDLAGHTRDCKTEIFSHRPFPATINYLGYPGTMGAPFIEYIIGDKFLIPKEYFSLYSEKIIHLPHCFQANDDKRYKVSNYKIDRKAYGLPEDGFVFCTFNNTYKITPEYFEVWMRILKQKPGSVLWLLGNKHVQENLSKEATARGVDPKRLIFAGKVDTGEYMRRYLCADLFLDSSPFNAGTTASDALWAGLPVLTCPGDRFSSRMAGSLLNALELDELIASSLEDYERIALAVAADPEIVKSFKVTLKQSINSAPVYNTALFTRNLEKAYKIIWERTQAGLPPDHIEV